MAGLKPSLWLAVMLLIAATAMAQEEGGSADDAAPEAAADAEADADAFYGLYGYAAPYGVYGGYGYGWPGGYTSVSGLYGYPYWG